MLHAIKEAIEWILERGRPTPKIPKSEFGPVADYSRKRAQVEADLEMEIEINRSQKSGN